MLPANKDARAINSFVECPIPSPRDYFNRYGARAGGSGVLTTDEAGDASISFSNNVIDSFNEMCYPLFDMILTKQEESSRLSALRDNLLPKLMSGEIKV